MSDSYGNKIPYDGGEINREFYLEGYHQAEKDLALTWEDIEFLANLYGNMDESCGDYMGSPAYYKLMLKKFNEYKTK